MSKEIFLTYSGSAKEIIKTEPGKLSGWAQAFFGNGIGVSDRWGILNNWVNHALVKSTFDWGNLLNSDIAITWTASLTTL